MPFKFTQPSGKFWYILRILRIRHLKGFGKRGNIPRGPKINTSDIHLFSEF